MCVHLTSPQAPEVARCPLKAYAHENKEKLHLAYSTASDIFSTGLLVLELLTGALPGQVGEWPCCVPAATTPSVQLAAGTALAWHGMVCTSFHQPACLHLLVCTHSVFVYV